MCVSAFLYDRSQWCMDVISCNGMYLCGCICILLSQIYFDQIFRKMNFGMIHAKINQKKKRKLKKDYDDRNYIVNL